MMNTEKCVAVEISVFGHGMKTMFQGMAEIFSSMVTTIPEDLEVRSNGWLPNGTGGAGDHESEGIGSETTTGINSPNDIMCHVNNEDDLNGDNRQAGVIANGDHTSGSVAIESAPDVGKRTGGKSGMDPEEIKTDEDTDKKMDEEEGAGKAAEEYESNSAVKPSATDDGKVSTVLANTGAKESMVPNLSQDDITRIIIQKIKQNRSNNEKIGQLLKTYGVSKVSDLPSSKYEAFITDLTDI